MGTNIKSAFNCFKHGDVMPKGWMAEYIRRDTDGFTCHLDELCGQVSSSIFTKNRLDLSKNQRRFWGSWWNGESESNWADGFIRTAFLSDAVWTKEKAENYIKEVLEYRDEDGYIGIYANDSKYQAGEFNGELWCQGRMLLAMLAYYEATGNKEVYDAIIKCALLTVSKYGPYAGGRSYYEIPDGDSGKAHGLTIIEPMLKIYELTKDKRFLDFCVFLYEDFSAMKLETPYDMQLDIILDPDRPLLSHGPHTTEHLRIPLLLYYYTGKEKYKNAYRSAYKKIRKYIGISGACKSDESIGNYTFPVEQVTPETIGELVEGFPLPETGYEYCATTELLLSLHTAFMLTGETGYADMAERLLFNAAMAARLSSGKGASYLSADNLYNATKERGVRWDYSPTHNDAAVCCIPNAGRIMPYHITNMWMQREDGLVAAFYGPCSLKTDIRGVPIEITEDTFYPFDERIRIILKPENSVGFKLWLRLPAWSCRPFIMLNGAEVSYDICNGFAVINRTWKDGDELELCLSAEITIEKASDGSAAVVRGPLVYSLGIKERWEKTKDYALEGFADYDCIPAEDEKWDYVLKLEDNKIQNKYFTLVKNGQGNAYPWDKSPVSIKAEVLTYKSLPADITLVPIGCTNLRRTCFPFIIPDGF